MELNASKMLSDILDKKDMSQKELADKLKVSASQVSRWLNRETEPKRSSMKKIKQVYAELTA